MLTNLINLLRSNSVLCCAVTGNRYLVDSIRDTHITTYDLAANDYGTHRVPELLNRLIDGRMIVEAY